MTSGTRPIVRWLVVALLAAGVLTIGVASAQRGLEPPAAPPPGQGEGPFGGGPGVGPGMGMAMMPMMGPPSTPAIAVSGGFVFVVDNGVLYKFSTDSLELVKQTVFAQNPGFGPGGGPMGPGGMPGGMGGPGGPGGGGPPHPAPPGGDAPESGAE